MQIKNRYTGEVIFEADVSTVRQLVELVVRSSADLRDADLGGVNLRYAYLSEADFRGANLSGADLSGADFLNTDLSGADLRDVSAGNTKWPKNYPVLTANLGRHQMVATRENLSIGCYRTNWEHWMDAYLKIGVNNGYTEQEAESHGRMIKFLWNELSSRGVM